MFLLFVPWLLFINRSFPEASEVLSHQTIERGLGTGGWLERSASPLRGYYLTALAKWTLPWVVFLPGALAMIFMRRFHRDRNGLAFMLLWIFGLVLLFSLAIGKHEQYILPAVPAACLLMGCFVQDAFFEHHWVTPRFTRMVVIAFAIGISACALGAGVALILIHRELWPQTIHLTRPQAIHLIVVTVLAAIPLWLAVSAFHKNSIKLTLACLVFSAAIGQASFTALQNLWVDKWNQAAKLGRQLAADADSGQFRLASWGDPDASLVWYSGCDIPVAKAWREHFIHFQGPDSGAVEFRKRLDDSNPPLQIVARLYEGKELSNDVKELAALGFYPAVKLDSDAARWLAVFRKKPAPDPSAPGSSN